MKSFSSFLKSINEAVSPDLQLLPGNYEDGDKTVINSTDPATAKFPVVEKSDPSTHTLDQVTDLEGADDLVREKLIEMIERGDITSAEQYLQLHGAELQNKLSPHTNFSNVLNTPTRNEE